MSSVLTVGVPTVSHSMAVADSKTAERREKCMVLIEVV
jgi:hypothetical protein